MEPKPLYFNFMGTSVLTNWIELSKKINHTMIG